MKKLPTGEVCGRCKFWQQIPKGRGDRPVGDCYGLPPTPLHLDGELNVVSARPFVDAADRSCSLFQPRTDA